MLCKYLCIYLFIGLWFKIDCNSITRAHLFIIWNGGCTIEMINGERLTTSLRIRWSSRVQYFCYDFAWLIFFCPIIFNIFLRIDWTNTKQITIYFAFSLSISPSRMTTRTKISPINLRCVRYSLVMHHWIEIFLKKNLDE